jgi:hypothetical protein
MIPYPQQRIHIDRLAGQFDIQHLDKFRAGQDACQELFWRLLDHHLECIVVRGHVVSHLSV